jgi:hypothetical protein
VQLAAYLDEKGVDYEWELESLEKDVVFNLYGVSVKVFEHLVWPYMFSLLDDLPENWTLSENSKREEQKRQGFKHFNVTVSYQERGIRS